MSKIREICQLAPVIPVLVVADSTQAAPLAASLIKGGLPVLEVTLRTPAALDAIKAMADVPGAVVGAGTLLSPDDVHAARAAGASFGVSPGVTDRLLDAARDVELPLLPGAATPTEVMRLFERGFDIQKFFPAEAAGGVPMLKSLGGPLPQVSFCPTGGVSPQNLQSYLDLPNVICVGGTWIADKEKVAAADWSAIESVARLAASYRGQ